MSIDSSVYIHELGISSVLFNTPNYFLKRPSLPSFENSKKWHFEREKELQIVTESLNEDDIAFLKKYLEDSFICKKGYEFQLGAYSKIYNDIISDIELFNAISISQNIIESLIVINYYDNKHKTFYLRDVIEHLLINKIHYTGALDAWNNKVLHNKILTIINDSIVKDLNNMGAF